MSVELDGIPKFPCDLCLEYALFQINAVPSPDTTVLEHRLFARVML
jgi:hypothetical protein